MGGWIRQGDPSLSTPLLNRAPVLEKYSRSSCGGGAGVDVSRAGAKRELDDLINF